MIILPTDGRYYFVYKLSSPKCQAVYIGQTSNPWKRLMDHRAPLAKAMHKFGSLLSTLVKPN